MKEGEIIYNEIDDDDDEIDDNDDEIDTDELEAFAQEMFRLQAVEILNCNDTNGHFANIRDKFKDHEQSITITSAYLQHIALKSWRHDTLKKIYQRMCP